MSQISPRSPRPSARPPRWVKQHVHWLHAFWKFSRPHTVIGTSLSAIGVYLIALAEQQPWAPSGGTVAWVPPLSSLLLAWIACLSGNIYIVGLNQLEDVAIDRINKPHLPLASKEFSRQQGIRIVAIAGGLALLISSLATPPFLFVTIAISLVIGTLYSLPPVRLKRFPVWASLCIFTVRGVIVNLGLYAHYSHQWVIPSSVWALTAFILVFTFAIAIFKDIPDTEGDRRYSITTFSLRLGRKAVFDLAKWTITLGYVGMIGAGIWGLPQVNSTVLVVTHGVALALLWWHTARVDLQDQQAIAQCYQFIWKLFFLEYGLFPLACLLAR
jgi:homogentisate phytyltransferase / homogentisate geranylgeranyltransferase